MRKTIQGLGPSHVAFSTYNRLFLNNGTSDPWNGVSGVAITSDQHATKSLALADVDNDGDLDLVVGNSDHANRLYRNNGTAEPWNGVTGQDIEDDAYQTEAIAFGDVDGDGSLDLVAGNWEQPDRLHRSRHYDLARGRATSLRVDAESTPITNATLTATVDVPPNTGVDYWLSNDSGTRWYLVRSGERFRFPTPGTDLRWRAALWSLPPARTPTVEQIAIITRIRPRRRRPTGWRGQLSGRPQSRPDRSRR